MHTENNDTRTTTVPERSRENPKPDPHDISYSFLKYETDLKKWKAIEALARHEHNEWIYATTNILPVIDEHISCIIDLFGYLEYIPIDKRSPIHRRVKKILAAQSERDDKWGVYRCNFTNLPFDRKEMFRYTARKAYEAMEK